MNFDGIPYAGVMSSVASIQDDIVICDTGVPSSTRTRAYAILQVISSLLRFLQNAKDFLQVINDLLDPIGQNLRIREDAQVDKLLSSG